MFVRGGKGKPEQASDRRVFVKEVSSHQLGELAGDCEPEANGRRLGGRAPGVEVGVE